MKLKICLVGLLCLYFPAYARMFGPVTIGNAIPDIARNMPLQLIGGEQKTLDQYGAGKLVILDFWATWCSSCIAAFPKLYALQKQYPDQLQVVLVNSRKSRDTKDGISAFLENRKSAYHFPCIYDDTMFTDIFPHSAIPFEVWIYGGKVVALTNAEEVNEQNIRQFIQTHTVSASETRILKVDPKVPLFLNGNGGNPQDYVFRSVLTGYNPSLNGMGRTIPGEGKKIAGFMAANASVTLLYLQAYPEYGSYTFDRLVFELPHPGDYAIDSTSNSWRTAHLYCYESRFPLSGKADAYDIMRQDLRRFFGIAIVPETRVADCWVLRLDSSHLPKTVPSGSPESNLDEHGNIPKYYRNQPLTSLVYTLCNVYKLHMVDETGYTENVSLELPADVTNEALLRDSLKKQGFLLSVEKRPTSFLVFRKADDSKLLNTP